MSFPSRSSYLCFLSGLSILALFVFFPLTFFGLENTSPSPFRTGSNEQRNCFCIAGGVLCLKTDFLLDRALVPSLLQRLCVVLRPGFLCLPIDVLLIHAVIPCLLQRFCIVLRPGFLCVLIDVVLIHVVVPGLLQRLSIVCAPVFLVSDRLSFVPRSSSKPSPNGFVLFRASNSIVFTPTFSCLVRHFLSFLRSHSFVLSLAALFC